MTGSLSTVGDQIPGQGSVSASDVVVRLAQPGGARGGSVQRRRATTTSDPAANREDRRPRQPGQQIPTFRTEGQVRLILYPTGDQRPSTLYASAFRSQGAAADALISLPPHGSVDAVPGSSTSYRSTAAGSEGGLAGQVSLAVENGTTPVAADKSHSHPLPARRGTSRERRTGARRKVVGE